jgi:hypothetical protein
MRCYFSFQGYRRNYLNIEIAENEPAFDYVLTGKIYTCVWQRKEPSIPE